MEVTNLADEVGLLRGISNTVLWFERGEIRARG